MLKMSKMINGVLDIRNVQEPDRSAYERKGYSVYFGKDDNPKVSVKKFEEPEKVEEELPRKKKRYED